LINFTFGLNDNLITQINYNTTPVASYAAVYNSFNPFLFKELSKYMSSLA